MAIFCAYHGTSKNCAINIVSKQEFTLGTLRDDHWLGKGAYFYREDADQALCWAKTKVKRYQPFAGQEPCILEVTIKLNDINFLNLDTRRGLQYLKDFIDYLQKEEKAKLSLSDDDVPAAKIRSYILSLLPDNIWVVQRTFTVDSNNFDKSKLLIIMDLRLHGIQVCVRNSTAIVKRSIKIIETSKTYKPRTFDKIEF